VQNDSLQAESVAKRAGALSSLVKLVEDGGANASLLQESLSHLLSTLSPPILSPLAVALQPMSVVQLPAMSRLAKSMTVTPSSVVQLTDKEGTVILLPLTCATPWLGGSHGATYLN